MTALTIDPAEIKLTDHRAIHRRLMSGEKRSVALPIIVASVVSNSAQTGLRLKPQALMRLPQGCRVVDDGSVDAVLLYRMILVRSTPIGGSRIRIADIVTAVAAAWGICPSDILGRERRPTVLEPRGVALALSHCLTSRSLTQIGRRFNGRHHTSVLHHVRKLAPTVAAIAARLGPDASLERWVRAMHEVCDSRRDNQSLFEMENS
ncbi:helix-turn-helix domain-containing protein [Labrys sp. 22185]|uniref:helix-turn-helix domain-containing protein n=1 Tax=Labrys sp. 22185 TaxID=3453888 RepID=UPI003F834605